MNFLTVLTFALTALAIAFLHEHREDRRTNLMLRPTVAVYGSDR